MREFLTFIGIVLCLALTALMVGPHFVDWGQYKPQIEQRIAALAGMPARIEGPVAVTLLPTPSFRLEQVRIGAPDGRNLTAFEVERIHVSLSATSLLRGEIHVTEALVDAPVLRLGPGTGLPPAVSGGATIRPEQVSLEALKLRDGRVVLERAGQPDVMVSALSAEVEVNSLIGPAKGSGSFIVGDNARSFRFALGKREAGRSRLKLLVEDVQLALRLDADGSVGALESGASGFEGLLSLSGNPHFGEAGKDVQWPLRASARSRITSAAATFDDLALVIGPEPQPLTMAGVAAMTFGGRHKIEAQLSARSFDFDRPGSDGKPRLAVPADLLRQAAGLIPGGSAADLPDLDIDLAIGGLIIGGQTIIGGRIALVRDDKGVAIQSLEGELPGQTRVKVARAPGATGGLLSGRMDVESRDPERFLRWFTGSPGALVAGLSLKASAMLEPIAEGLAFRGIEIERGETRLAGQGSFQLASPGLRPAPHLALKLASPKLNIADVPTLVTGDASDTRRDLDFDIDMDAGRLVFEGNETGRLVARVRRDGDILSLERVAVTDFGGASLIASGTIGGGARRVTVKLDATKVDALAALGEKILPGPFMTSLRQRAPQLAPALVVATFMNDAADDSYDIKADGHLAGTKVQASGKLSGRTDLHLDLDLGLENADAGKLAGQIGGNASPVTGSGPATVTLSMRGNPRAALSTVLAGAMPGIEARVIGNIRVFKPFAPFEGDVTIRASDLAPIAGALGISHPAVPRGTAGMLSGRVASTLQRVTVEDFKADIGGQPFTGEIAFSLTENGKVAGQVRTPQVDLRPALALAFGAPKAGVVRKAGDAFGPALTPPLSGDLWVETGKARVDDTTVLDDAKFVLRFEPGAASIEYSQFRLGQARIEGDVFVRRNGASAFLSGKLKAAGIRLDRFGNESVKGTLDGELQVSGGGETPARLIAALAGGGTLNLRNPVVPRFDPNGLNRLLGVSLDTIGPIDAFNLRHKLETELDRASWTIPDAKLPLVVVNGQARTGAWTMQTPEARHEAQAALDLDAMAVDFRVTTTAAAPPADWPGAPPQVMTQWRGPLADVKRSVSVDALVNGYLALGLVRDLEKSELLDQDIRERAAQSRRRKAEEAMVRRTHEIERFEKAERERLAREQALEEQRQKEARLAREARLQAEREAAERQAREQAERDAARQRDAEAALAEERRRVAEEEAARVQRIQRILQQPETTAAPAPVSAPARRSSAGQPPASAPLPPPMNLSPPGANRPRAAAPVEIRPLQAPEPAR